MDDTLKNVLIANDGSLSKHLILKSRSMGMTTALKALEDYRALQHSDDNLAPETIYTHDPDSKGRIAPVKTQMAAKFPLKSRRERRQIQRQVAKLAAKERAKGESK